MKIKMKKKMMKNKSCHLKEEIEMKDADKLNKNKIIINQSTKTNNIGV